MIDNYEILNSPRIPIASVVTTRLLRQEESTDKPVATTVAAPAAATAAAPAATPAKPAAKPAPGKK
jgi:large subunit ribosomal protein L25